MSALISVEASRLGNVLKHEYERSTGFCRKTITVNDSAATFAVGRVLVKYLASGSASATAGAGNTGTGTVGTITVGSTAKIGTYTVRFAKAVSNAGDFYVTSPSGRVVGTGSVGVVFTGGGLSFTISDATDFVVGDTFTIAVTGTEKYRTYAATDVSDVELAIYIADSTGNSGSLAVAGSTDTTVTAIVQGPVIVAKQGLSYDSSVDTDAEIAILVRQLAAQGIVAETQI